VVKIKKNTYFVNYSMVVKDYKYKGIKFLIINSDFKELLHESGMTSNKKDCLFNAL